MNAINKITIALYVAASLFALPAAAQTYPSKPIRVIVPYPPGGTSDILTRLIGAKLTESLGQQVIADNRSGASGNIGSGLVARSAPDGYTLLLTDIGNLTISSVVFAKLPFNVLEDFTPVTTVSYSPHLLATHPSVPVKTTQDLIALAKSHPGKLNGEETRILGLPDIRQKLDSQGTTPLPNTPQATARWLADERARWLSVVKASGFKLEQ